MDLKIVKCQDESVVPKCPNCKLEVYELLSLKLKGGFMNESNVVVCPHCHVILGYGKVNYM